MPDLDAGRPLRSIERFRKAGCVVIGYYEVVLLESDTSERPSISLRDQFASAAEYLGAVAEQVGDTGELLGNYPQAFTHLGLISAAWDLNKALGEEG